VNPAAWGVIGTAVGALASIGTTWLTNRNNAHLQTSAKIAERIEAQRAYQRQTILELQDAFHDAIRLVAQVHLEDCKAERDGTPWGRNHLPDDLSENMRVANRRVMLLVERISDESLRTQIKSVMTLACSVTECSSRTEAVSRLDEATMQGVAAIVQSGAVLRSLYEVAGER
jgi:hypothetical protein